MGAGRRRRQGGLGDEDGGVGTPKGSQGELQAGQALGVGLKGSCCRSRLPITCLSSLPSPITTPDFPLPSSPSPALLLPVGAPQGGRILLPSLGTKAQRLGSRMAEVLPGSCALPSPEQWLAWHSNVITPFRKTGEWGGWVGGRGGAGTLTSSCPSARPVGTAGAM